MRILSLALALSLSACTTIDGSADKGGSLPFRDIVNAQQAAWNRGDIEGFMSAGYWRSPEMTFFSESSVTRGYQAVLDRYVARYKTGDAEMGRLTFSDVEVEPLDENGAFVRGRWDLDFEEQADVGGLFTLVFRRISGEWRIVHDHTSL
jgi:ketosteroid isomerase-like protein